MDFKFAAFEDIGDWRLASSLCNGVNEGPCADNSFSQKAGNEFVHVRYIFLFMPKARQKY